MPSGTVVAGPPAAVHFAEALSTPARELERPEGPRSGMPTARIAPEDGDPPAEANVEAELQPRDNKDDSWYVTDYRG